ncbi:unnamed protein product [Fraxinus pennsylvanica]|uniref:Leucine-rich repeat-containing N-terminal plant-type domain-containing protein n=1 Tax=Fraxinus pennsylvanica TaxID=56036 RepID=A0AAD2A7E4_9LAMI|nr:unnamed protein product [Fraxinus pennsylvanica]
MKILITPQFFSILITTILCTTFFAPVCSQSLCLEDQKILLLKLKDEFLFNSSASRKLVRWNENEDCCSWNGVGCDTAGHVISLELENESIIAGFENSTSLFTLQHLEKLNLAFNDFRNIQIPRRLYNLTHLTHLNLSEAGLVGQIPCELSSMKRLVSLDLSNLRNGNLSLRNPDLRGLVQNLTELQELHIDGVEISSQGIDWCQVLSFFLPNLREVSLRRCDLSGPIDSSFSRVQSLSVLHLDDNNLSTTVPDFFANFSNLTSLSLSNCSLEGFFPNKIFQVPTLLNLDLSYNILLKGTLPQFPRAISLRNMVLCYTNFSGSLPDSISNLVMLSRIDLSNCKFSGKIPSTITNLTEVVYLDFSNNNFSGLIPPFHKSKKLTHINLSHNRLAGPLSYAHFQGMSNLYYINLGNNLLTGNLPSALFVLPSLRSLLLLNNQLDGQIEELPNPAASQLCNLDLSSNKLEGPIPKFFFKFEHLTSLSLSFNFFSGTFELEMIKESRHLRSLEVSSNNLSIDLSNSNSTLSLFPNIETLKLASCKLQEFPNRLRQLNLSILDLSANQLKGEIPTWIWEINNGSLSFLNLSFNQLTDFQKPYEISSINMELLDLSSNQLRGELPIPPLCSYYVDYSNNNFNGSIPPDIGNYISFALFFSVSNNSLSGAIPMSMCNAHYLELLDLSNNALNGTIPSCLTENNGSQLKVLNLRRNRLNGTIPDTFSMNCSLETLDLSQNFLAGKLPESLVNCPLLEVLNIENNRIEDTFPCMLMNTNLLVLVLRSNRFYGDLHCPGAIKEWRNLQIMDISVNHFTGDLSPSFFSNWKGMINFNYNDHSRRDEIHFDSTVNGFYYQETIKKAKQALLKIKAVTMSKGSARP